MKLEDKIHPPRHLQETANSAELLSTEISVPIQNKQQYDRRAAKYMPFHHFMGKRLLSGRNGLHNIDSSGCNFGPRSKYADHTSIS